MKTPWDTSVDGVASSAVVLLVRFPVRLPPLPDLPDLVPLADLPDIVPLWDFPDGPDGLQPLTLLLLTSMPLALFSVSMVASCWLNP